MIVMETARILQRHKDETAEEREGKRLLLAARRDRRQQQRGEVG